MTLDLIYLNWKRIKLLFPCFAAPFIFRLQVNETLQRAWNVRESGKGWTGCDEGRITWKQTKQGRYTRKENSNGSPRDLIFRRHHRIVLIANFVSFFFFFWIFQNWEKDQEVKVGVDNTTWQILAHQPLLYAKLLWRKLTLDIACQIKK